MNVTEEVLMAYVDGELEPSMRDQIVVAIAADPDLARRVARYEALNRRLRAGFDPVLAEPVPERLLALARNRPTATPDNVVPLRALRVQRKRWAQWGSLAASFFLGAVVWHFVTPSSEPVAERHGQLVAAGYLARALSGQLAAQQEETAAVRMGVSFRSKQGTYCRTFQLRDSGDAGLACHAQDDWHVQLLAHGESASAPGGVYRQAATSLPPAVLQAVSDTIAGDAMDSAAEAAARAQDWKTSP